MSLLATRIRLIRETHRLYRDHADSLRVYSQTTGAEVNLGAVDFYRDEATREIIEATTLDNI